MSWNKHMQKDYKEINWGVTAENKCYFSAVPFFKLKLLLRRKKISLYKALNQTYCMWNVDIEESRQENICNI